MHPNSSRADVNTEHHAAQNPTHELGTDEFVSWAGITIWKGHGTENDFVVLPDLDDRLNLTDEMVQALCDRRAGIGGDGLLRVVRSEHTECANDAQQAPFFMDYRNADASVAEMCGNGVRVFVRYLQQLGLIDDHAGVTVATRGGLKNCVINSDDTITVDMGAAEVLTCNPAVQAVNQDHMQVGTAVLIPNPHVVVTVADIESLRELDLSVPVEVRDPLPQGQNVEYIYRLGSRHLAMRVQERGVGETRSCGTGICAAVVAAALADGTPRDGLSWDVDVAGGRCQVQWQPSGEVLLTGPAELVGTVTLHPQWLAEHLPAAAV